MFSQTRRVSIINLHAVNWTHKLWELLLAVSPTKNCSNASSTSSPEMSAPRASLLGMAPGSCCVGHQGTSRGKNGPRGCTEIAAWCLRAPAGTTQTGTWGREALAVSGSDLDHNPSRVGRRPPTAPSEPPEHCPAFISVPLIPRQCVTTLISWMC